MSQNKVETKLVLNDNVNVNQAYFNIVLRHGSHTPVISFDYGDSQKRTKLRRLRWQFLFCKWPVFRHTDHAKKYIMYSMASCIQWPQSKIYFHELRNF